MTNKPKLYDSTYRQLFNLRESVEDLAESSFEQSWRDAIRWDGAQAVAARWVRASDLAQRENDIVWRLPCAGSAELYLYLMIELQARQERDMLLRMDEYAQMFRRYHWDQQGAKPGQEQLPRLLPLVLYTGDGPWQAPTDLESVTQPLAPGLEMLSGTGAQFRYAVLGAQSLRPVKDRDPNVVESLLGMLGAQPGKDLEGWLESLKRAAARRGNPAVPRALERWFIVEFAKRRVPGVPERELRKLWEGERRPSEVIGTFEDKWRAEGREEGRAEGRAEGQRETLMRMIRRRFGARLAQSVAPRIEAIRSTETLSEIVDEIAVDETPQGLLDRLNRVDEEPLAPS